MPSKAYLSYTYGLYVCAHAMISSPPIPQSIAAHSVDYRGAGQWVRIVRQPERYCDLQRMQQQQPAQRQPRSTAAAAATIVPIAASTDKSSRRTKPSSTAVRCREQRWPNHSPASDPIAGLVPTEHGQFASQWHEPTPPPSHYYKVLGTAGRGCLFFPLLKFKLHKLPKLHYRNGAVGFTAIESPYV